MIKHKYYEVCNEVRKRTKEIKSKIKIINELELIDFNPDEKINAIRRKAYNSSICKVLKYFIIDNRIENFEELLKELCKLSLKDISEWDNMSLDRYKRIIFILSEITKLNIKNEKLEEYEQIEEEIKRLKEEIKRLKEKKKEFF